MAVLVVDGLETVKIQIRHGQKLPAPVFLKHALMQTIRQQHPVWQGGQYVIVGDVLELSFVFLQGGDVRAQGHIVPDNALIIIDGADGEHLRIQLAAFTPIPDFAIPMAVFE